MYPRSTILLDALDECNKNTREVLMETFDMLLEGSSRRVKIFVSSRRDVDILKHFETRPAIQVYATDNGDDIAKFQWAALQIKQILELRNIAAIQDRLGKLPKSLKESYDILYQNIEILHPQEKQLADRAFQWVLCAYRPLKTEELILAVCVNSEEDEVPRSTDIDQDVVLELCQNLLIIDLEGVWRILRGGEHVFGHTEQHVYRL
ncbi:hypothetical protein CI238_02047 [Colletotrichum incanum]|uniref:NACHT domain-containing protein n=1 Tax=Colletotrichum incanum TaxID=1573173 RepID=A0A167A6T5_COLIC|nr:hypothetical protein CI238_02047 [Colletotrichum incanum]